MKLRLLLIHFSPQSNFEKTADNSPGAEQKGAGVVRIGQAKRDAGREFELKGSRFEALLRWKD